MSSQVKLYKSSNYAAQPLTNQRYSLNAVLKACLVNGYGSTAAAGWNLEYEDTGNDICVFRNQTAFLYSAFDSDGWQNIKACEAFTNGNCINPTASVKVRYDVGNSNIPYAVIADEKSFYLKIDSGNNRLINQVYFFGDFVSLLPGDLYNFAITGIKDNLTPVCAYNGGEMSLLKNEDGTSATSAVSATKNNIGTDNWFGNVDSAVNYPFNGAVFREKPFFCEASRVPRGKLPGLTIFGHKGTDLMSAVGMAYRSNSIDDTVKECTFEGTNYIALHTQKGIIFLDMDNW